MSADLDRMTDEELLRSVRTMSRDNPGRVDVEVQLSVRSSARQLEAANRLVTATDNLVTATKRMMWASWALVFLTAITALITIFAKGGHG